MYLFPVVEANYGRHETNAEFIAAVRNSVAAMVKVLPKRFQDDPHKILNRMVAGISELDEADKPSEHPLFRKTILDEVGAFKGINWPSYEPMAVGTGLRAAELSAKKMCDGVPKLTPTRTLTRAMIDKPGNKPKPFRALNHHAPRNAEQLKDEIAQCKKVHRADIKQAIDRGQSGITMGDWNDPHYPVWFGIETALHNGLDYIRFWNAPGGAVLDPVATASFRIGIDGHKGGVVLFAVS